jgi:hypothetical protein
MTKYYFSGIFEEDVKGIVRNLRSSAEYGYRIVCNGKTIWAGLGNRSGLHSYANTILYEKWNKLGVRFLTKVEKLIREGATEFEIHDFRNINRDRGVWRPFQLYIVKETK